MTVVTDFHDRSHGYVVTVAMKLHDRSHECGVSVVVTPPCPRPQGSAHYLVRFPSRYSALGNNLRSFLFFLNYISYICQRKQANDLKV